LSSDNVVKILSILSVQKSDKTIRNLIIVDIAMYAMSILDLP